MAASSEFKVVSDIPDSLLQRYLRQKTIAMDTEFQGLRLGRDQVSLVQICDRDNNVCIIRPTPPKAPPNLKKLLTHSKTVKVFHYALADVAFLKMSLGIDVHPFNCTKVMSKLIRTYTDRHSLKALVKEIAGFEMDKDSQSSNWEEKNLSPAQLKYAANDVIYLLQIYETLGKMLKKRGKLPSGISPLELNAQSQAVLPTLVQLILNGYGDRDSGWETSIFVH